MQEFVDGAGDSGVVLILLGTLGKFGESLVQTVLEAFQESPSVTEILLLSACAEAENSMSLDAACPCP